MGCDDFGSHIAGLSLQLLDAHDVRLLRWQPLEKAFICRGADTVQVEGYNSHAYFFFVIC